MAETVPFYHCRYLRSLVLLSVTAPALMSGVAHAQHADETARQMIRLKAYGMYSSVNTNFQGDSRNNGVTIGGDIDGFRLLPRTEIGMDVRYTFSRGLITNQYYYGGGPRLTVAVGPFKPYVDFLFGHGSGVFNRTTDPTYTRDSTGAPTYGGGLEYQLTRSWGVRADVQRQIWRFSSNQPYFYPVAASVGLSYQFRFHGRTGPNL